MGLLLGIVAGLEGWTPPLGLWAALLLAASPPLAPVAFVAAGWLAASGAHAAARPGAETPVEIEGRVTTVPAPVGERLRYTLRETGGRRLEVVSPAVDWPLAAGDQVRLSARLHPPPGARNPGGADPAARLAALSIPLQAEAAFPPVRTAPPSPLAWLERGRQRFAEAAAALPPREAALVRAIGTGDRAALDPATNLSFVRSGLAHILAVSGLHLVVVAAGLERAMRWLLLRSEAVAGRLDPRRTAAALAIPATALYAVATGAGFSIVRAAVASGAVFLGTVLDREGSAGNALGLAVLACLGAEPGALLDPSLQLSLASVAGLLALAGPLRAALPWARGAPGSRRARWLDPVVAGLCTTVAASLATAPVLALQFRRLPALGVLANVAGVPIGTALTGVTALAAVVAMASPALAVPLVWLAWPLARALLAVSDAAAAPSFAVLGVASPGPGLALLATALILLAPSLRGRWRWLAAAGFAACLALPGPLRAAAARWRGGLELIQISVGQGDSALLRLPDGRAVLLDGGGTFAGGPDPGARDVVPLLRDLGIGRLAAVIVSHPHPDHILGLASVAAELEVDRLLVGESRYDERALGVLAGLPPPERLRPGAGWTWGGVRFRAVGPSVDQPEGELVENDASLVLRVEFGATAFLFPGDLEAAGEAAALRGGLPLGADVVKVPHHGSRTSSTRDFVVAVRPRWAVVSCGAGNRFGFPHDEPMARWREVGAVLLRTDQGAVRLLSDGRAIHHLPAAGALDPLALLREPGAPP